MRILFIFMLCILGIGCASYSSHHTRITGSGTYIYDGLPITGNVIVDGYSCAGIKCPSINEIRNVNGSN